MADTDSLSQPGRADPGARDHATTSPVRRQRMIGLLGGMSCESTALYYQLANAMVRERLGGLHSARCLILSVDFAEIERMQVEGRWDEAGGVLADAAGALQAGGAEALVLCTNTMHRVAERIEQAVTIPFLHIGDVAAMAVRDAGLTQVGLLGTGFTMGSRFYHDRIAQHGISVLTPDDDDRRDVHRIIYDELCLGRISDASRSRYRAVIERLVDRGAQGVLLACTEIELLIGQADSPVPVFPTTELHVQAAVEWALST
jgi:amino-acid racemase